MTRNNRLLEFKHIEINIWKACNNKCKFCMSSKPELWDIKFVPADKLKEKISKYAEQWFNSIWFLWWDISIYPKFYEIIEYSKKVGFQEIQIITNWMVFSSKSMCQKVIDWWLTRINMSIHSHIDEVENYLTWVTSWLKKKLQAIDNFNEFYQQWFLKSPISINIVLNSRNLQSIVETVLYYYKVKNIKDIRINFIWLDKDIKENWDDLKISYTEFLPYLKKLVYISLKYNIRVTFDTVPPCILNKVLVETSPTLIKMFLWEDFDHITQIDHINKDEQFNWKERKKNMLKRQFEPCTKCVYTEQCQWVRYHYGELYWWWEFQPIVSK